MTETKAADTTATFTIAAQWGNNNWGTNICLQSGATSTTVKIKVQNFNINPGNAPYNFYVFLTGNPSPVSKTTSYDIDVNNVIDGSEIKVIVADPSDITKKYGEQALTFNVISHPTYTLSTPLTTVCLNNEGDGSFDLLLSPYKPKVNGVPDISYEFRREGGTIVSFDDKGNGTFTRTLDNGGAGTNSYSLVVTENGCISTQQIKSPTITFVRSPKLNEKPSYLRYLSQGGTIFLKDLFNNTTSSFDNDYTFEDLSGKNLVMKQGNSWIFKGDEAGEGVYTDIIAYTPKSGTCSNGKTTVGTEIKILNDKESLVIFLKATKELPICANQEKYPLQVLIKEGCQPPLPQMPEIIVGGIPALNIEYVDIEESINCHIYSFEIEPIKYNKPEVDIKVVGLSSIGCDLSGTIKIAEPNDPNISGLPETVKVSGEDVAYICGSSSDTISMRANPSGGYYTIEKGVLTGGIYTFKTIGNVKFGETSEDDQSLEQFVPSDVFGRIITSNFDSLIKITYTSPKPCPATKSIILKFLPSIGVTFTHAKDTICFGDTLELDVVGSENVLNKFSWNFGDGERLSLSPDTIVHYSYKYPGRYFIRFQTNINSLEESMCNNDVIDTIYVGAKPTPSYSVYNNYENEEIKLISSSKIIVANISDPTDEINKWKWRFGDTSLVENDKVTYPSPGVQKAPYKVLHIATAKWGCSDTAILNVPIFPVHTVSPDDFDKEQFNTSSANGWYHTGQYYKDETKSSWRNVPPNGVHIKAVSAGDAAWFTSVSGKGGYNADETSWVESPVYEIGNLQLPMLSMDTWTDMNYPFDGVAVQFAFVDTTAFGKEKWQTLGEMDGEGLNWYNFNSVSGRPGNEGHGWTDNKSGKWSLSAYRLDTILKLSAQDPVNRKRVRFRIVLGTTTIGQDMDGFAFDNFFVGQRNRKIIVEEFCDHKNEFDKPEAIFIDPQALRIQYHLSDLTTEEEDEINSQNPYEPSARGLLYGIGKTLPRVVLDGIFYNNDDPYDITKINDYNREYTSWINTSLLERSLITSPYNIKLNSTNNGDSLKIEATIEKSSTVTEDKNYVVQVAIVEKVVQGNDKEFTNVLRQMVPNSAGHRIDKNFEWTTTPTSETTTINASWKPTIKPTSDIYVIAFLQDEDTKEIYQSDYLPVALADYQNLYSGARPGSTSAKASFSDLTLSPNPTAHDLMVRFDGVLKDDYTWSIIDVLGNQRNTGLMLYGTEAKILNTEQLGTGMYYLKLEGEGRSFIKKFSVVK